jgi:hypothetical protein
VESDIIEEKIDDGLDDNNEFLPVKRNNDELTADVKREDSDNAKRLLSHIVGD